MKWFKRDKQSIPITEKTIRDVSDDNENPVTFASGLDDSEREKELEEFGYDRKSTFNTNPDYSDEETAKRSGYNFQGKDMSEKISTDAKEIWKEVEQEISDIEKDKNITLDDKIILFYNIYEDYKDTMPRELTQRILADLASLDEKLQEIKREEGLKAKEEKLHDRIKTLKQRLDEKRAKSRNIPVKSTSDLSTDDRKKVESKSHERIEDWEHTASLLLLEAESM